jgi:altronate dehydratase
MVRTMSCILPALSGMRGSCAGYQGMPNFKIRPAAMSLHGRQYALDFNNQRIFSVAKRSRISSASLRHNLEVSLGERTDNDVRPKLLFSCFIFLDHHLFFIAHFRSEGVRYLWHCLDM